MYLSDFSLTSLKDASSVGKQRFKEIKKFLDQYLFQGALSRLLVKAFTGSAVID